jgi:hypothetical protein
MEEASARKSPRRRETAVTRILPIQASDVVPLPVEPPIGGPLWSYVVPALLLVFATLGTYLLYRHFAKKEG